MPLDLDGIIAHVRAQNRPGTHQAVLLARVDELEAEIDRLRTDCAQFYQVIGALAYAVEQFDDEQITKALDNALAAAEGDPRPHEDLLPFHPVKETTDA